MNWIQYNYFTRHERLYFCGVAMLHVDDNNMCCSQCGCSILVINICLLWIWGVASVIIIVISVRVVTVIIVSGGLCSVCNKNIIKCM